MQMSVQSAGWMILRQPVVQKRDGLFAFPAFIANMGEGMRAVSVQIVDLQRPFDQRPRFGLPADLGQGHAVMAVEPPVVAVVGRQTSQERCQVLFASSQTRHTNQAALVGGEAKNQGIARPGLHMSSQRGEAGGGLASEQQPKHVDMALLAFGGAGAVGRCGGQRLPHAPGVAGQVPDSRLGDMGQCEPRIGGDGTIQRGAGSGEYGQQQIASLDVGIPGGIGCGG